MGALKGLGLRSHGPAFCSTPCTTRIRRPTGDLRSHTEWLVLASRSQHPFWAWGSPGQVSRGACGRGRRLLGASWGRTGTSMTAEESGPRAVGTAGTTQSSGWVNGGWEGVGGGGTEGS